MLSLALSSFVALFLELALIRYLGASIWNLGYFPNFVLLAALGGMGAGLAFGERRPRAPWRLASLLLLGTLGLVAWWHPAVPSFSPLGGEIGGELFFSGAPGVNRLQTAVAFPLVFCAVAALFASLGAAIARDFKGPPLVAYSINVGASVVGVAIFTLLSWRETAAWIWFATALPLVALGALRAEGKRAALVAALSLAACVGLARAGDSGETHWSPYQKVTRVDGSVFVNGINHQSMQGAEALAQTWYPIPYIARAKENLPAPDRVLILGSGTGNDVAAALMAGARHVDAVEIDPAIAEIGQRHHPLRPYANPRVTLHVEDGRNFLNRATGKYDLILFALTDSLVRASAQSQLRLENYLFTYESIRRASQLLSPRGKIVLYNFYRQTWLAEKLTRLLSEATGVDAQVLQLGGFTVLLSGGHGPALRPSPDVPTDDWPFLYLRGRAIPPIYLGVLAVAGLLSLAVLLFFTRAANEATRATSLSFFFMGISFALLETKSIIQCSLLFGTSWLNNALVIIGVLASVLAANALAMRLRATSARFIVLLLVAACFAQIATPGETLIAIPLPARYVAAALFLAAPVFFANLLFGVLYRDVAAPARVLGWNLLGSIVGGTLEYASLALGYRALGLLVAAGYLAAVLLARYREPFNLRSDTSLLGEPSC